MEVIDLSLPEIDYVSDLLEPLFDRYRSAGASCFASVSICVASDCNHFVSNYRFGIDDFEEDWRGTILFNTVEHFIRSNFDIEPDRIDEFFDHLKSRYVARCADQSSSSDHRGYAN